MQLIPGTDKLLNHYGRYSDEHIFKEMELKPLNCFGKKGTVYIHSGNTVHKLRPKKGTKRYALHFEFTAGSNILLDCKKISKSLDENYDLSEIEENKRDILKGLFPINYYKGYEVKGNDLIKTRYKGI